PSVVVYLYDNARVIEEQTPARTTLATYTFGNYLDEVLMVDRIGQTYFYHQNALRSVMAMTDAAGNSVERYSYTPYGATTTSNGDGSPLPANSWGTPHSAIGNSIAFTGR